MVGKLKKLQRCLATLLIFAFLAGNLAGIQIAAYEDVSGMTDQEFFGQSMP